MPEYIIEVDGASRRALVYMISDFGREPIAIFFHMTMAYDYVQHLNLLKQEKESSERVQEQSRESIS